MSLKKELRLERFRTESISGQSYVTILCKEGALWITTGKGFDDIILRKDQQMSLMKVDKIVIEALKDSHIFYSVTYEDSSTGKTAEL